jgi:hypothetical protein
MASRPRIAEITPSAQSGRDPLRRALGAYRETVVRVLVSFRPYLCTVSLVDVRIGVTQAPRELTIEVPDDERDDAEKQIEAALGGAVDVLWLTDKRGKRIGIPAAKLAYVEVGTNDGDRRIGFGG